MRPAAARHPAAGTAAVAVAVTFLRMDRPPATAAPPLPGWAAVVALPRPPTTGFYRYLYRGVGERHLWWMRLAAPEEELRAQLAHPGVSVHVLYAGGEPGGFYELDRRRPGATNLSYFGLMPHLIGRGLGGAFLRHAVDAAWAGGCAAVTVNTCSADHPRALPNYLAAGFAPQRTLREVWQVPLRLGLPIPPHLAAG